MASRNNDDLQRVLEHLEFKILSGVTRPRERLIERELIEEYGVSRGTIRKILKELAFKHLIKIVSHQGAIVSEPTPKEVEEIYHTRMFLENHAIDLVIANIQDSDIETIDAYKTRFEQSLEDGDLREIFIYNRQFHKAMFDCCGNGVISELIDDLRKRSRIWYSYFAGSARHRKNTVKDHNAMVDSLQKRDAKRLKSLNKNHLTRGYRHYKEDLRIG